MPPTFQAPVSSAARRLGETTKVYVGVPRSTIESDDEVAGGQRDARVEPVRDEPLRVLDQRQFDAGLGRGGFEKFARPVRRTAVRDHNPDLPGKILACDVFDYARHVPRLVEHGHDNRDSADGRAVVPTRSPIQIIAHAALCG